MKKKFISLIFILITMFCSLSPDLYGLSQSPLNSPPNNSLESIYIVYHLATLNNWKEIATEQLLTLEKSNLLEACTKMFVTVVGSDIEQAIELFQNTTSSNKIEVIHASVEMNGEFPGIIMAKYLAEIDADAKIFYMHAKGVRHWQTYLEKNMHAWRIYMEYFTIERWQECVHALDSYDICGVNWTLDPVPHFSGNFWWARAEYLRTIPELQEPHTFENRTACEFYVGSMPNVRVKDFHNSNAELIWIEYTPDKYR